jgi:hypothetical protein
MLGIDADARMSHAGNAFETGSTVRDRGIVEELGARRRNTR